MKAPEERHIRVRKANMSDEQLRAKGEQVFRYLEENHALAEL